MFFCCCHFKINIFLFSFSGHLFTFFADSFYQKTSDSFFPIFYDSKLPITRDGSVHKGRDEKIAGAHCTNHNQISIGVCYIGGCASRSTPNWNRKGKDTRTPQQKTSMLNLLKDLKHRYPGVKIYGHRDFANKACPSFDAKTEFANL